MPALLSAKSGFISMFFTDAKLITTQGKYAFLKKKEELLYD